MDKFKMLLVGKTITPEDNATLCRMFAERASLREELRLKTQLIEAYEAEIASLKAQLENAKKTRFYSDEAGSCTRAVYIVSPDEGMTLIDTSSETRTIKIRKIPESQLRESH